MLQESGPKNHIISWVIAIAIHLFLFALEFDITQKTVDHLKGTPIIEVDYVERMPEERVVDYTPTEEVAEKEKKGLFEKVRDVFKRDKKDDVVSRSPKQIEEERIKEETEKGQQLVDRSQEFTSKERLEVGQRQTTELRGRENSGIADTGGGEFSQAEGSDEGLTDKDYRVAQADLPFEVHDRADAPEVSGRQAVAIETGEETSEMVTAPSRAPAASAPADSATDYTQAPPSRQTNQRSSRSAREIVERPRQRRIVSRDRAVEERPSQGTSDAGEPEGIFQISGPLSGREVLKKIIPQYPDWAKKEGINAACTIRFELSPSGEIRDNLFISSTSGFPRLDRLALEALRKWRFEAIDDQRNEWGDITFYFYAKFMQEDL
ncbi:MAG: energy transducer TonB [Elusimicrobiota bacterium]